MHVCIASLCDSLRIQINFKEDLGSYIRENKEGETGIVDEIKLGEREDLRIFSKYLRSTTVVFLKDVDGI